MTDDPSDVPLDVAVDVAALAKKSSVAWIRVAGRTWPVWHEWVDTANGGAVCVVGSVDGTSEQPIPDVVDGAAVTLLLRNKTDRALAVSVIARVEIIGPGSAAWEPTTAVLKAGRLNLRDADHAVERWARECRVLRIVPVEPIPARELSPGIPQTRPSLS